ncbi:radical SAM protein [Candidatus Aalborgicola defluviihabitans]|uniref:radical SAM protein n=1 Tax=Candidatus Aalborgicola defluviihabitans TaxID=3386187 RepID=UPI001ECF78DD|nr:SPASM domain-containing protein [Burkholderiales bacterium]
MDRAIHLLYVPTLCCNLSCSYCYLGKQTTEAALKKDAQRAVQTLRHTLDALKAAGVLAFNVSLHGGEVTTLPAPVLDELFGMIRTHYLEHFDALNALGHKKSAPHIKTNLFKFAPFYDLFDQHKVSISASIDLPLALHARHRTTRGGTDWLPRTLDNIRLLARYPHAKKISATLSAEHLADIPALVHDIWFIHRELGFDMNQFNLMFAFGSELNRAAKGEAVLTPATPAQQQALYAALKAEFTGTELEEGLKRNWFDEFKPSYCTNAANCGERFYLLQSDGAVYSCVRGQGIEAFRYGNVFEDPILHILDNGARKIRAVHQAQGFDASCQSCNHLSTCNTGCAVVKYQNQSGKSYTCGLQKTLYQDNPLSYPADDADAQRDYARHYQHTTHPSLAFAQAAPRPKPEGLMLPNDLIDSKNALGALIAADPVLQVLFSDKAFILELAGETLALDSQLFKQQRTQHTLVDGDRVVLHLRRDVLQTNCPEAIRNTLYLQLLRDTPVVYGDEQRTKQEHIFTYQLYANCLEPSTRWGDDYLQCDLTGLLALHRAHFQRGVLNNLFVTTLFLREYHYQKQKANAFYHVQTANLPFQNVEFHYLP